MCIKKGQVEGVRLDVNQEFKLLNHMNSNHTIFFKNFTR